MFNFFRNHVVGFYYQNVWKTPVEEWHVVDDQLLGLSIIGTLFENGLNAKHGSFFIFSNDNKKLVRVWTKHLSPFERSYLAFAMDC